jgi:hypothetical protein
MRNKQPNRITASTNINKMKLGGIAFNWLFCYTECNEMPIDLISPKTQKEEKWQILKTVKTSPNRMKARRITPKKISLHYKHNEKKI